jgi:molybdopterin converting factor small subunit
MAQLEVHLWSGLRRLADGKEIVSVEAETIGTMLRALSEAHPGLAPILEDGVSVAVNGDVIVGGHARALHDGDEIFLLQQMKGG